MPIYGKAKTKTMIKSILPSTARKRAKKAKDDLHRKNRRRGTQQCVKFRGNAQEVIESWEDNNSDLTYWLEAHNADGWDNIVSERRQADKLAHFERWAYERTKHLPRNDRLSNIAAKLPKGVIGEHAVSHLNFLEPVHEGNERFDWIADGIPYRMRPNRNRPAHSKRKHEYTLVFSAVRTIARDDAKRAKFNEYLTRNAVTDKLVKHTRDFSQVDPTFKYVTIYKRVEQYEYFEGVRTLNGYHDIYKFMHDIYATCKNDEKLGYHPSWLINVKKYFNID